MAVGGSVDEDAQRRSMKRDRFQPGQVELTDASRLVHVPTRRSDDGCTSRIWWSLVVARRASPVPPSLLLRLLI